ncbi:hypothetical protein [Pseudomonas chlororaphis]|uniref:hypothetical protein n=1 Tax=Pseudomonas chlororaphis TaxID=587753 RepID=UPI0015DE6FCD|nr:hypothetical protein [Pseudomonas chlororaphis]QLL11734.1 hypothetical protein H0I86_22275 [Pseudomonas chlororaphis subsp. aurantiaca]
MNIDWSKAPEGVTGFHPDKNGHLAHWVKLGSNGNNCFCVVGFESSGWVNLHSSRISEDYRAEIINAPVAWNGEGLPPVGTVCERNYGGEWKKTTICGHSPDGQSWAAFYDDDKAGWLSVSGFRPIRTPEQIAAEERKKIEDEIQDICTDAENSGVPYFEALYDAGYRKQVAP